MNKYLSLITLLFFFMACSSSEEEFPKTDDTITFDKSYYLSLRNNLEADLYKIGDKISEKGTFFSDTEEVRKIMEEVYEPNSLNLNAFDKATIQVGSASRLKTEVSVKEPTKSFCASPSLYTKIQKINELLDKSNSPAEYVEVLENLFNEAYEGDLSSEEKSIILHLIVSQQVSADFIKNNPELFLMKEASLVKSKQSDWDYYGKCLTGTAGSTTLTFVEMYNSIDGRTEAIIGWNTARSGSGIIGSFTTQAINCKAGFGHPKQPGGGGGPILSHIDDAGPQLEETPPDCNTCGRIYVEVCPE